MEMICIIGDKDTTTGFSLAGIKKQYDSPKEIKDEKVIFIDQKKTEEFKDDIEALKGQGKIIVEIPRG